MRIITILRKSLHDYRMNPVLFVPAAIELVRNNLEGFVAFYIFSNLYSRNSIDLSIPVSTGLVFAFGLSSLFFGFAWYFVFLGQGVMSGRVVCSGKTKLADWIVGIRRFFLTVFAIGLLYAILSLFVNYLTSLYFGWMPTYQNNPLFEVMRNLLVLPLYAILDCFFLLCLASITLGNNRLVMCLIDAWKTLRKCLVVFGQYVLLYWIVDWILSSFHYVSLSWDLGIAGTSLIGNLTISGIVVSIVSAVLSPIWFLMIFEIYHEQISSNIALKTN